MQTYTLNNRVYQAENCIEGILVDPILPDDFFETPAIDKSSTELNAWWCIPFIVNSDQGYKVVCLEGETRRGPTVTGPFEDLDEALDWAKSEEMLLGEIPQNLSKTDLIFLKMAR